MFPPDPWDPLSDATDDECDWTGCREPATLTKPSIAPGMSEHLADTRWCAPHFELVIRV